jgi:hypothetical protein
MTSEEEEKVRVINELGEFWKVINNYTTYIWKKFPQWLQSTIRISIWVVIMAAWISQLMIIPKWQISDIPLIYCVCFVSLLGTFYFYIEFEKLWGKK